MTKKFKIIILLSILWFVQLGCSAEREETSTAKAENQMSAADTSRNDNTDAKTDSVLVTFIELGSVKCIPCKMMQPIMDEIEKEYPDQVKVVFHDVWTDEGRPYAQKYGIRAIPTQVFLDKNGKEYFRHQGFFPRNELIKVLKKQGVQ